MYAALPGGEFTGKGTRGWKRNGKGNKWTFLDKTDAPINGFAKMIIQDRSAKAPNLVKVVVKGKNGTYPIVSGDEPIEAIIVLGGLFASLAGQCGYADFAPDDCRYNARSDRLTCRD